MTRIPGTPPDRDPEVTLAAWLDEGPVDMPDETRRAILGALPTTSQARRGPFPPWRLATMNRFAPLALGAATVVAVAAGGLYLLGVTSPLAPGSSTASPTSRPTPALTATWAPAPGGTITLTDSGCTWAPNPSPLAIPTFVSIVNETTFLANFKLVVIDTSRVTWDEAAAWFVSNAALQGGPSDSPQDFATVLREGNVWVGQAANLLVAPRAMSTPSPGTLGVVCSVVKSLPSDVLKVYLVGPLVNV